MSTRRVRRRQRGRVRRPRARRSTSSSTTSSAPARDPRHAPAVERLWRRVARRAATSTGATTRAGYCVGCEQFYDRRRAVDGRLPRARHRAGMRRRGELVLPPVALRPARRTTSIAAGELAIQPGSPANEVLAFVRGGLDDISVSRPARPGRRLGHPGARRPGQVIYVWWDALTNYITALDFGTRRRRATASGGADADDRVHVIGKGILRFHAVYWPALLLSAGPAAADADPRPPVPHCGAPSSRSRPATSSTRRRWSTSSAPTRCGGGSRRRAACADADFTTRGSSRANDDLADGFGNLVNRVATMLHRLATVVCRRGHAARSRRPASSGPTWASRRSTSAVVAEISTSSNRRTDGSKRRVHGSSPAPPRAGDSDAQAQLSAVLGELVDAVREIGVFLQPLVPSSRGGSAPRCNPMPTAASPTRGRSSRAGSSTICRRCVGCGLRARIERSRNESSSPRRVRRRIGGRRGSDAGAPDRDTCA